MAQLRLYGATTPHERDILVLHTFELRSDGLIYPLQDGLPVGAFLVPQHLEKYAESLDGGLPGGGSDGLAGERDSLRPNRGVSAVVGREGLPALRGVCWQRWGERLERRCASDGLPLWTSTAPKSSSTVVNRPPYCSRTSGGRDGAFA